MDEVSNQSQEKTTGTMATKNLIEINIKEIYTHKAPSVEVSADEFVKLVQNLLSFKDFVVVLRGGKVETPIKKLSIGLHKDLLERISSDLPENVRIYGDELQIYGRKMYILLDGFLIESIIPSESIADLVEIDINRVDPILYYLSKVFQLNDVLNVEKAFELGILNGKALSEFEALLFESKKAGFESVAIYVLAQKIKISKEHLNKMLCNIMSLYYLKNLVNLLTLTNINKKLAQCCNVILGLLSREKDWLLHLTFEDLIYKYRGRIIYEVKLKYINEKFVPVMKISIEYKRWGEKEHETVGVVDSDTLISLIKELKDMMHKAEEKQYTDLCDYLLAKKLGIKNAKILELFKKFVQEKHEPIDFHQKVINLQAIQNYFEEFKKYKAMLDYNLQCIEKRYKKILTKSSELWIKAHDAFKNKDYGYTIIHAYSTIMKLLELAYQLITAFPKITTHKLEEKDFEISLPSPLEKALKELASKVSNYVKLELPLEKEIAYWRRLRNKVVHEAYDVQEDEAKKALIFFEELRSQLVKVVEALYKQIISLKSSA